MFHFSLEHLALFKTLDPGCAVHSLGKMGWAPLEVSYPLSDLFDLLSPSASPISAQRLSNAR